MGQTKWGERNKMGGGGKEEKERKKMKEKNKNKNKIEKDLKMFF